MLIENVLSRKTEVKNHSFIIVCIFKPCNCKESTKEGLSVKIIVLRLTLRLRTEIKTL